MYFLKNSKKEDIFKDFPLFQTPYSKLGCYSGTGQDYRGSASFTKKGTPCMKWTDATDINPDTDPGKV